MARYSASRPSRGASPARCISRYLLSISEQGCVSALKCLFEPVTSGYYYGSDGLRSPLTMTRDPGAP